MGRPGRMGRARVQGAGVLPGHLPVNSHLSTSLAAERGLCAERPLRRMPSPSLCVSKSVWGQELRPHTESLERPSSHPRGLLHFNL